MVSLILIPISIVIFLRLNRNYQFIMFTMVALYPFSFGDLRSVPDLFVIEWLTIITFISLINQLVPVYSSSKRLKLVKYRGIEIFVFATIILAVWTMISFVNNEILSTVTVSGEAGGTRRTYFDIFNNILIFYTTIIFFATQYEKLDVEKILTVVLYSSVLIGIVRAAAFYLRMKTPLLSGIFDYNPASEIDLGTSAQRLLGLDFVAAIGISAQFALYIYKKKFKLVVLFILLIYLFLSGGRTAMIGVVISISIFSLLFLPKNFVYFIVSGGLLLLIAFAFLPEGFLQSKLTRLSTVEQAGFLGQDIWRGTAWYFFLKNFAAHPIIGKGIGNYSGFIYSTFPGTEGFVRHQMASGGHGSYISLLSTLGLGGILYFLIMILGGIILSLKKSNKICCLIKRKLLFLYFVLC